MLNFYCEKKIVGVAENIMIVEIKRPFSNFPVAEIGKAIFHVKLFQYSTHQALGAACSESQGSYNETGL